MDKLRVKISGYGGQGIILSSYIVGKAVSIYDGKSATMTQAYGPEARGGACSSQVVIDKGQVDYPLVDSAEVLVALSQEGYDKFFHILNKGGVLFYDKDLVTELKDHTDVVEKAIPATRIAENMGKKIVANIVMLGYVTAQTKFVTPKAMEAAIRGSVPQKYVDLNIKAFTTGYKYKKE
ncbi:MAG: 2-oxoacid:acceptor oxidoreductase family protein [Candidatus Cloacimonetes bacterium]|nr:2-oxoacid:acceptor oxidoreductase family protein [Candidatus Cloacimonadota bacterium]MBS3767268.1 2-oxoacid:acceptor oxidoreductase family protein [Candidatus Cloacimonadota bacterium]